MLPCPNYVCRPPAPESFVTTPLRCSRCSHVHFWGEACEVQHIHGIIEDSGDGYWVACRCKKGVSRSLLERIGRPSVPQWVKRAVLERDGLTCCFCGRRCLTGGRAKRWPKGRLTLDHIIPWSKGGKHTVNNLRVACLTCNVRRGTGDLPLFFEAA